MFKPFVVVSLGRCGSSSLAKILNALVPNSCLFEPFNPALHDGRYYQIAVGAGLSAGVASVARTFAGFKHVCGPTGWPFSEGSTANYELMTLAQYRTVLLHRKNNLRRIVSDQIALQCRVWQIYSEGDRRQRISVDYSAVSADVVRRLLAQDKEFIAKSRSELAFRKPGEWHEVRFDALFDRRHLGADRVRTLREVLSFLGYEGGALRDGLLEGLLDEHGADTSIELYSRVPDLAAIEREFGSEEAGFLFGGE